MEEVHNDGEEWRCLLQVGLPPEQPTLNHFSMVIKNLTFAGSVIGNLKMTQEMLDFCGQHDITSMVEVRCLLAKLHCWCTAWP